MNPAEFQEKFAKAWEAQRAKDWYYYPEHGKMGSGPTTTIDYGQEVTGQKMPSLKELKLNQLVNLVQAVAPQHFFPIEELGVGYSSHAKPYAGVVQLDPMDAVDPAQGIFTLMHEVQHVRNRDPIHGMYPYSLGETLTDAEHEPMSHAPFFGATRDPRYTKLQMMEPDPYWGRKGEAEANLMGGAFERALFPERQMNPNWRLPQAYIPAAQYVTDMLSLAQAAQEGRFSEALLERLDRPRRLKDLQPK